MFKKNSCHSKVVQKVKLLKHRAHLIRQFITDAKQVVLT